jgi:cytochrome c oxidase cbb3-type subunit 3
LRTPIDGTSQTPTPVVQQEEGKKLFAKHCASCHGDDRKGKLVQGAPDLTDSSWIYGGDPQSILDSIWLGRKGHMPAWEGRLSATDRKILVLYLLDIQAK